MYILARRYSIDWMLEIVKLKEQIQRERRREKGVNICDDKNVLLKALELSARLTTVDLFHSLFYYTDIE